MDFETKRRNELLKRRKRLIKILVLIILILLFMFLILKSRTENSVVNYLGMNLTTQYSKENFEYKKVNLSDENEYLLVKRLSDEIYYEKQEKINREYVKSIYYFELKQGKGWTILEDEKIIITDDYIDYMPEIIGDCYSNISNTYAENYVISNYNLLKPSDKISSLKSIINKKTDNKSTYEIKLKLSSGIEKTYIDKDTLLPIKTIVETEKNGEKEYSIEVVFDTVTYEDFKIIDEYKKMTELDYKEYKRVIEL